MLESGFCGALYLRVCVPFGNTDSGLTKKVVDEVMNSVYSVYKPAFASSSQVFVGDAAQLASARGFCMFDPRNVSSRPFPPLEPQLRLIGHPQHGDDVFHVRNDCFGVLDTFLDPQHFVLDIPLLSNVMFEPACLPAKYTGIGFRLADRLRSYLTFASGVRIFYGAHQFCGNLELHCVYPFGLSLPYRFEKMLLAGTDEVNLAFTDTTDTRSGSGATLFLRAMPNDDDDPIPSKLPILIDAVASTRGEDQALQFSVVGDDTWIMTLPPTPPVTYFTFTFTITHVQLRFLCEDPCVLCVVYLCPRTVLH